MSLDAALGYVYLPVEVATSDYYGGHRHGDNLFSSSLVCLNARTGERVWHYQIVHHDIYEYDNSSAPILMDVTVEGQAGEGSRPAHQAVVRVRVRIESRVRRSGPSKSVRWAHLKSPARGHRRHSPFNEPSALDRQGAAEVDLIDLTPAIERGARRSLTGYRLGPLSPPPRSPMPPTGPTVRSNCPVPEAVLRGRRCGRRQTGMLCVGVDRSTLLALHSEPGFSDIAYVSAGVVVDGPRNLPLFKPPFGHYRCRRHRAPRLDEAQWRNAAGDPRAPRAEGVALKADRQPRRAVLLATRTLLFAGEGWQGEPFFRAYDKKTGVVLAELRIPAQATSLPMTYMHQGKQYIVFAAGDARTDHAAELIALTLAERVEKSDGNLER
jgi:quinoprotein glucose dehydrogenase